MRFFLSCLARVVRLGLLEVHAYCVLTTHFHLLVRSPRGRLSEALQRIEDAYARRFNRSRRRDGSLFRGRFWSSVIDSDRYWLAVLRYIDENPVEARLAHEPGHYPFGSAFHYRRGAGPPWLSRDFVEAVVCQIAGARRYRPEVYGSAFPRPPSESARWCVERRLNTSLSEPADLDDLVGTAPERVQSWMVRKALLADGTSPGVLLLSPRTLRRRLAVERDADPRREIRVSRRRRLCWLLLEAGLLRAVCGLSSADVARLLDLSPSTAHGRIGEHERALRVDEAYAKTAARIVHAGLLEDFPDPLVRRP